MSRALPVYERFHAWQGEGTHKPKPNGPKGDYDIFKQKYSNVVVGTYASNSNSIDMLDEEYHTFRYLLLQKWGTGKKRP